MRGNAGCYRPFTVTGARGFGSQLHANRHQSACARGSAGTSRGNIFRALADAAPDQVQASTGLPVAINVYGRDGGGTVYADHFFMGGGQGGSPHGDGKSGAALPDFGGQYFDRADGDARPGAGAGKELRLDSGGAGTHRGGCGVRTRLRKLYDDGLPMLASVYPEGVGVTVDGLHGGHAGGSVRGVVLDRAGNILRDCGTGELVTLTSTIEIVEVTLAGGAGFGDPRARPPSVVARDVAEGLVSPAAAERIYGLQAASTKAAE